MTRIEKHWNQELFKKWISIVFIAIILQSFFQGIREVRFLSEHYGVHNLLTHLAFEAMVFTLEFFPITLFIAALALHDEWKKKDYYLSALLDGVTPEKWRHLSMRNGVVLLCLWVPLWFIILPSYHYTHTLSRLTLLQKEPKINLEKIYIIDNELAYIQSAEHQENILDLKTQEVKTLAEVGSIIENWKKRFIDFKIGVDNLSIQEKFTYLPNTQGKENALLWGSLMKDGLYIISLLLCWVYITVDREFKIFSTKRDEVQPQWNKRILHVLILYWGTKIMPLLARFFHPLGLIGGYIGAVCFSLWV